MPQYMPPSFAEHDAKRRGNHAEKFSIGGSRFTSVSPQGVREKLESMGDGAIAKFLGLLGEGESPAEAKMPKIERLVNAWVDGRLPDLAKDLGLEPTAEQLRKMYGA